MASSPSSASTSSSVGTSFDKRRYQSKSSIHTPFVLSCEKNTADDERLDLDSEDILEQNLGGEIDRAKVDDAENKDAPPEKPRTSRTTATKVSPALLQKIVSNQSGTDLKITGLIPFDAASQLCEALASNDSTDRLDLEGCGIGDKGCILIRDLLHRNTRIKHVDLQMNQISDVGCKHLAEGISLNTTLQRLYLGYNDIRDDGVKALINAMRPRGQLEIVVNGNTHVSDETLALLDCALEQQWMTHSPSKKENFRSRSPSPNIIDIMPIVTRNFDNDRKCREESNRKSRDNSDRKDKDELEVEQTSSSKRPRPSESSSSQDSERSSHSVELKGCKTERVAAVRKSETPVLASKVRVAIIRSPKRGKEPQKEENASINASDDYLDLDREQSSKIYMGAPFSYEIIIDSVQTAQSQFIPANMDSTNLRLLERQRLLCDFNLQWNRFQEFLKDQLDRECRQLNAGSNEESIFEISCRFLTSSQFAPYLKHMGSSRISALSMQSEANRRRTVESRVKALLLKFRHIQEDTIREQRCQAHFLAAMHGNSNPQGPLPAGCSPESTVIHVPCPFKLHVCVHGLDNETEYLI